MLTTSQLVKRTLRIPRMPLEPLPALPLGSGRGEEMIRRLDAALMTVGFKLSAEALEYFSKNSGGFVKAVAVPTLAAVRELCGDHVRHNSFFIGFPESVPDTMEFWVSMLRRALMPTLARGGTVINDDELRQILTTSSVNLLQLPTYGTYQHTFEELVAAHEQFISAMKDRVTILHLGGSMISEMCRLFEIIASTPVPPNQADRALLADLVRDLGANLDIRFELPGRETKAVINAAILDNCGEVMGMARPLVQIDTVTDVLRAVDVLSGGNGTLERPPARKISARPAVRSFADVLARSKGEDVAPVSSPPTGLTPRPATRFVSLKRCQRRRIMQTLHELLVADPHKVADVYRHREAWKRLGEDIHPHEFANSWSRALLAFAVARGEVKAATSSTVVEDCFVKGEPMAAAQALLQNPGAFARSLDRLLRHPASSRGEVLQMFGQVAPKVSGRVLLSLMEHFLNRGDNQLPRTFVTRTGRLYVTPDTRDPLPLHVINAAVEAVEAQVSARLDDLLSGGIHAVVDAEGVRQRWPVVVDPAMEGVAVPLSNKGTPSGLGVLPRGSMSDLDGDVVRLFTYWRERASRTDFDLSVLIFDESFEMIGHVSWTHNRDEHSVITYSGDITESRDGATEFIDIRLTQLGTRAHYIVPQVFIYCGEQFGVTGDEPGAVAESFFGYMSMDEDQRGMPFEARTVRTKADMRGRGSVATPLVIERCVGSLTGWRAKWVHLYAHVRVADVAERNSSVTGLLAQAMIRRRHLTVGALVDQLLDVGYDVSYFGGDLAGLERNPRPITYIGLDRPEWLPEGSRVITMENLTELIPE
jgi:hypothetical protein